MKIYFSLFGFFNNFGDPIHGPRDLPHSTPRPDFKNLTGLIFSPTVILCEQNFFFQWAVLMMLLHLSWKLFFHLLNYFLNNGESKKDFWHRGGMAAVRSTHEWRGTSISADTRRYLVTEIRGRSQAGVGDNSLHAHELRQQASDTWPTTSYTSINF